MKIKITIAVIAALALSTVSTPAGAQDSVRLSGTLTTEQCPVGFQYSLGLEVNATTQERFTWCNAAPNVVDLQLRAMDEKFEKDRAYAESIALLASRSWNEAHPGQQKCFTWGPVKHPNGIGEAGGGVCANPVGELVVEAPVAAPVIENVVAPVVEPIISEQVVRKSVTAKPVKKVVKKATKKVVKKPVKKIVKKIVKKK